MEQFDFPTAETKDIISTFLNQSCVLLRNFVDAAALERAYDMTLKAYERIDGYHVHPHHLREFGLPMYSDVLFGRRHFDLLREVFGKREYEISSETSARRMGHVRSRRIGCRRSDRISTRSCIRPGSRSISGSRFRNAASTRRGSAWSKRRLPTSCVCRLPGRREVWDDPAPRGSYIASGRR